MMTATNEKRVSGICSILWMGAALILSGCGGSGPVGEPVIGEPAPDFTLIDLTDGRSRNLSEFRGKIVVADFWASWCGPCQETMEHFQIIAEKHAEWDGKVVLLSVSIDDKQSAAEKHLKKKGWDKTRNAWVDPRGGKNPAVRAYAGKGIPAGFIVDAEGTLVAVAHPNRLEVERIVGGLLSPDGGKGNEES